AGHRVLEATHGAAAIALLELRSADIDLVICDLVMPVLSGREVGRWLAAHSPGLPILFVSGYPRAYLEAHELYDPDISLLRKPFLPSRLLEAVDDALRPAKI
ncbi:MAG: response regulator, partial [Gemmatimonadales bacterium]